MKKFVFSACLLLLLFDHDTWAQSFKNNTARDAFRSTQGYIGLFGGSNFSQPYVSERFSDFSMISSTDPVSINDQKEYGSLLDNTGAQFGISAAFTSKMGLSLAISPAYQVTQYKYESQFVWQDAENETNYLEFNHEHSQRLHYVSLPLLIRYTPLRKKFRPYVQIGVHYDRLFNAQKNVRTRGLDRASGSEVDFAFSTQSSDVSRLYIKSHFGLLAGGGFTYNLGTLILFFDGQYRYGMHTTTNAKTRYSGSRDIPGFGNVLDNVTIRNLQLSFGCYFPLKFLTKDFSPVIL